MICNVSLLSGILSAMILASSVSDGIEPSTNLTYHVVRSSCRAPVGAGRLGYGHFHEFSFAEKVAVQPCRLLNSKTMSDGERVLTVSMVEPYNGFVTARLSISASNRLYKVELEDVIGEDVSGAVIANRISKIAEDLSRQFKKNFSKETGNPKVAAYISKYANRDERYPIEIILSRVKEGKKLRLVVESTRVKSELDMGIRCSHRSVPLNCDDKIDVDI